MRFLFRRAAREIAASHESSEAAARPGGGSSTGKTAVRIIRAASSAGSKTTSSAPQAQVPQWLSTPLARAATAAVVAIGGAAGVAIWNYGRSQVAATPPVRVTVQTNPAVWESGELDWIGYAYVIPRTLSDIGTPPPGRSWDWYTWAHQLGGADAWTRVQVTLEGRADSQVLIDRVWVNIVKRRPPLKGTAIYYRPGGAYVSVRLLGVDLDTNPPTVTFQRAESEAADPEHAYRPFTFSLSDGEVEVFYIDGYTEKHYVEWTLTFRLIANGEAKDVVVTDHGKPFRTTSTANSRVYAWYGDGWESLER
jgi:hypothetical protein